MPSKKTGPKFHRKPHVQSGRRAAKKKHKPLAKAKPRELRERGWMICGFDTSMSSIAGAAIGYDKVLDKFRGPVFSMMRWSKEDEYFDRLREAAKSHEIVQGLQADLGLVLNLDEIFIAQEEPWPLGMVKGGLSSYLKQQAEISGAFLGGLIRYGYQGIWQINSIKWRTLVAQQLGITTHHSKWKDGKLAQRFNCRPNDSGKFRAKQWALSTWDIKDVPDWPDIIESSKEGKIPRPENSKAKAVQADDRYDALAIAMWLRTEISEDLTKNRP